MNKRFLNKIVDQIMRETEIVHPTIDELGYVNFPFSVIYDIHDTLIKKNWTEHELNLFFSAIPSFHFKRHLEEIYSLNTWGDPNNEQLHYLWDRYIEKFMNKLRKGINIVDAPDNDIPQRWVGQIDESFKKESGISFLIKVVDQLIDETEIRGNRAWGTWALNNHLTPSFWQFLLYHCRDVYGLNDDEVMWVQDYYKERLDSKLRNNLSESKVFEKDNEFLDKLLNYLIDNTKVGRYEKLPDIDFHYSGYIIVPIGSGFRFDVYNESRQPVGDFAVEWWGEMKDVYSLKNEEVIPLLEKYDDFLWRMVQKLNSDEVINESWVSQSRSWQNDSFLDKVVGDIMRETKKINGDNMFSFPFLDKPLNVINSGKIAIYVSFFVDHCIEVYGIYRNNEIDDIWFKYIDRFKKKYKIGDSINESKSLNGNFLNKLLDHIKSETKFEPRTKFMHNSGRTIYAGNYVRLPFFPEDWYRGLDDMYITDFIFWINTTLGINDTTEIEYLWKRYKEWVNKKCNE